MGAPELRRLLLVIVLLLCGVQFVEMFGMVGKVPAGQMGMMLKRTHANWLNRARSSSSSSVQPVVREISTAAMNDDAKMMEVHRAHMFLALRHAQFGLRDKEVPIGAVIVGKFGEAYRQQLFEVNLL
jgi:hypothetical protein